MPISRLRLCGLNNRDCVRVGRGACHTRGVADNQNGRVAVYLDFDNIVLSWYDRVHGRNSFGRDRHRIAETPDDPEIVARLEAAAIDVGAIIDYASSFGTLVLTRGYADWSSQINAQYRTQLVARAIDLVQLFPAAAYAKNGADIRLAVDTVEDMFRLDDLTHVVIVGGDSDYVPLAQRCKRLGRYVVGIGVAGSTAKSLTAACDEFASYDTLPGVERPRREEAPARGGRGGRGRRAATEPTAAAEGTGVPVSAEASAKAGSAGSADAAGAASTEASAYSKPDVAADTGIAPVKSAGGRGSRGAGGRASAAKNARTEAGVSGASTVSTGPAASTSAVGPDESAGKEAAATSADGAESVAPAKSRSRRPARASRDATANAAATAVDATTAAELAEAAAEANEPARHSLLDSIFGDDYDDIEFDHDLDGDDENSDDNDIEITGLLIRALWLGQEKDDSEWLHSSAVKQQMRRMDPSFNEKALGFRSFSDFLKSRSDIAELEETGHERLVRLRDQSE